MIQALSDAGYDKNNPDHFLIICGDLLDRGNKPVECLKFVNSIPDTNKALILGNHELLLKECLNRKYFCKHDFSNGTMDTVFSIFYRERLKDEDLTKRLKEASTTFEVDSMILDIVSKNDDLNNYFNSLVNYHETKKCIYVHGWIPIGCDYKTADQDMWNDATWVNGFTQGFSGNNKTGKDIVFGHWHCSYGWAKEYPDEYTEFHEFGNAKPNFNIYEGTNFVGIDGCTALTKKVNVRKVLYDSEVD